MPGCKFQTGPERVRQAAIRHQDSITTASQPLTTASLCVRDTHFECETFKSPMRFIVNQLSKSTKSYKSYDASPTAQ